MAKDDVFVESGEVKLIRCPRTGKMKEVDLSLNALSKTMQNIQKSAEIINNPKTSYDMAIGRYEYIEELVLDSAQFSPRLQNLQIKIKDKVVEVVKNLEEFQEIKHQYMRDHFIELATEKLKHADTLKGKHKESELKYILRFLMDEAKVCGTDEAYNKKLGEVRRAIATFHKENGF